MHRAPVLDPALGRARVVDGPTDPHRRAIAVAGTRVIGLGAFEPLYGPRAEFAIALRDPGDRATAQAILGALARAARALELRTLRAEVCAGQRELALGLDGVKLTEDAVLADVERLASVATTDGEAHLATMAGGQGPFKIVR